MTKLKKKSLPSVLYANLVNESTNTQTRW